jgi:cytochrome c556
MVRRIGLGGGALLVAVALAAAQGQGKPPSVKEIMKRGHAGEASLLTALGRGLKADAPAWDRLQKETKELVELGQALAKNTPPVGDKGSWEKLTRAYLGHAEALDSAVKKHDRDAAQAARARLNASCKECHKAHRKQDDT